MAVRLTAVAPWGSVQLPPLSPAVATVANVKETLFSIVANPADTPACPWWPADVARRCDVVLRGRVLPNVDDVPLGALLPSRPLVSGEKLYVKLLQAAGDGDARAVRSPLRRAAGVSPSRRATSSNRRAVSPGKQPPAAPADSTADVGRRSGRVSPLAASSPAGMGRPFWKGAPDGWICVVVPSDADAGSAALPHATHAGGVPDDGDESDDPRNALLTDTVCYRYEGADVHVRLLRADLFRRATGLSAGMRTHSWDWEDDDAADDGAGCGSSSEDADDDEAPDRTSSAVSADAVAQYGGPAVILGATTGAEWGRYYVNDVWADDPWVLVVRRVPAAAPLDAPVPRRRGALLPVRPGEFLPIWVPSTLDDRAREAAESTAANDGDTAASAARAATAEPSSLLVPFLPVPSQAEPHVIREGVTHILPLTPAPFTPYTAELLDGTTTSVPMDTAALHELDLKEGSLMYDAASGTPGFAQGVCSGVALYAFVAAVAADRAARLAGGTHPLHPDGDDAALAEQEIADEAAWFAAALADAEACRAEPYLVLCLRLASDGTMGFWPVRPGTTVFRDPVADDELDALPADVAAVSLADGAVPDVAE